VCKTQGMGVRSARHLFISRTRGFAGGRGGDLIFIRYKGERVITFMGRTLVCGEYVVVE